MNVTKKVSTHTWNIRYFIISMILFFITLFAVRMGIYLYMDNSGQEQMLTSSSEGESVFEKQDMNTEITGDLGIDVQNGLLYSNENGQITDKDGKVIDCYADIAVLPNGALTNDVVIYESYFAGAGGKIIFEQPKEVEYEYSSDENIVEDNELMMGDYYNLNNIDDWSGYVMSDVCYRGVLMSNDKERSIFTIAGGGIRDPYIEVHYDREILRNYPENSTLQEYPVEARVWGNLQGSQETGFWIEMEYIYIGSGEKQDVKEVNMHYFMDWPEDIGEQVKYVGTFSNEDGQYIGELAISFDVDSFGNIPRYGYATLDSFNGAEVAVYGSMVGSDFMCISYIEPLPSNYYGGD